MSTRVCENGLPAAIRHRRRRTEPITLLHYAALGIVRIRHTHPAVRVGDRHQVARRSVVVVRPAMLRWVSTWRVADFVNDVRQPSVAVKGVGHLAGEWILKR